MIQRKQTLFLIFSILIMVGYIFSPVIHLESGVVKYDLMAKDITKNVNFPIIGHYFVFMCMVGAIVTASINFIAIFLYKNRKLQIVFCWLSILPALFCLGYVFNKFKTTEMTQDQWFWYGNISPVIAVAFIIAAIISIRADEELVKSVDRLR